MGHQAFIPKAVGLRRRSAFTSLACATGILTAPSAMAQGCGAMQDLYALPGGIWSRAFDVSSDGAVVVGMSATGANVRAFRWTSAEGMQSLGEFPSQSNGWATAVSGDGNAIGGVWQESSTSVAKVFIWTPAGGIQDISTVFGIDPSVEAFSSNGSVMVGHHTYASVRRAFARSGAGPVVNLPLVSDTTQSLARDVTPDGTVIVGMAVYPSAGTVAFRWTSSAGTTALPTPPGWRNADAVSVSSDGAVIVGSAINAASQRRAVRWTISGMQDLGTVSGGQSSQASAVSADGSVVVGWGTAPSVLHAFRWTAETGMRDLGVVSGGTSSQAVGVSDDGRTVIGYGLTPSGLRSFRWTLCPDVCPADFNQSTSVTPQDIFDYLNAWFTAAPRADFNGVSGITPEDIFDFLNAWFAGCP